MQTTIRMLARAVCLMCFLASARAVASYVRAICDRNPIHTTALKTAGDNGFKITIEGTPVPDKYRPGETYTGKSAITHSYCYIRQIVVCMVSVQDVIFRKFMYISVFILITKSELLIARKRVWKVVIHEIHRNKIRRKITQIRYMARQLSVCWKSRGFLLIVIVLS